MASTPADGVRRHAPKRYSCGHEGCGKAFTRSSHLLRHSQNHTDVAWSCERCEASFKRQDLLERHTARHGIKDKRAGGTGLGKLVSKRRQYKTNTRQHAEAPGADSCFILTSPEESTQRNESFLQQAEPGGRDTIGHSVVTFDMDHSNTRNLESDGTVSSEQQYITAFERDIYPDVGDLSPFATQQDFSQVITPPRDDLFYESTASETNYPDLVHNSDIDDFINSLSMLEQQSHVTFDPFKIRWPALETTNHIANQSMNIDPNLGSIRDAASSSASGGLPKTSDEQEDFHLAGKEGNRPSSQGHNNALGNPTLTKSQGNILQLPPQIRERILHLILETHPVTPKGTQISMDTPELSLRSMQDSLDLFASHFNISYPMIHIASFNIESVDHVLLLSMMLIGSTYKSQDAHQMSVCLYDALIPHVFGGLSNNSSPELPRLQSLLLLDYYGMYRAGPNQRHNALLLHQVLLSSISIISRYHVKARIGLPAEMITSAARNFRDFAYAEQYKRVVLLFFMCDVQNACFFSVTPSLSIEELDLPLPCTTSTWLAATEEDWGASRLIESRPETLASAVKFYLDDGAGLPPPREDMLTLTLSLHGLMSICNGMRGSIRLHTFHDLVDWTETSWRSHMCTSLEFWKARYDAFAMDNIQALESEILHCDFQRDSMGVFAIYRAAYIVVNVEVRHLQIAAGAATIFGHTVEKSDYATSTRWIKDWAQHSPEEVGRATWQAGQMFREGMLNLKDWYVHDVFHYPWTLYLATLTCWAASSFSSVPAARHESNSSSISSSGVPGEDMRKEMNRLVSMLASANPSNMARLVKKCNTDGLTKEMAKYLRTVRWAAAHEAMTVLEGLSTSQA